MGTSAQAGGGFLCAQRATPEPSDSPRVPMPRHAGVSIPRRWKEALRY